MDLRIIALAGFASLGACDCRSDTTSPDATPAGPDDPRAVFTGCVMDLNGPTSRLYRCGRLIAEVREERPTDPRVLLDGALAGPRGALRNLREERLSLVLGGSPREVYRLTGGMPGPMGTARDVVALIVVVPTPDDGARLGTCLADLHEADERRCRGLLAFFIAEGSTDSAISAAPSLDPPSFLGVPLTVPANCEVLQSNQGGGHIRCADGRGELQWRIATHAAAVEAWAQNIVAAYRAEFDGVTDAGPELSIENFGCKIGGSEADCTMLNVYPSQWIDIGWTVVRERAVGVLCMHPDLDPISPPVCNGLIE